MPSDLIVLTASNGENRKLAERFVQAAAAQNASAELIDLTSSTCPCSRHGSKQQGRALTLSPCTTSCTQPHAG